MKKLSKCLVLIGAVTITIGISGLFESTNKINKNIGIQEPKAYNHNTENALDNVFIQDNNLILPFIFNNKDQANTLDIRNKFARAGLTVRNISTEAVGTGTQITVNENTNVYNLLIYGDVNGDGLINLIDVQNIILHYLGQSTLTGLNAMAGNVNNNDNNINLIDAQRVILFYLGNLNTGLVVKEPEASNSEKPIDPVEDTISKITITPPTKRIYTVGEEINLAGGKINIVYVSGKVESINIQKSMVSGYNMSVPGSQTVTVYYRVNSATNFTATFDIQVNILNKEITTIIAIIDGKEQSKPATSGICYKPVEFLLKSGENEKNINVEDLSFIIKLQKDNKEEIITDEKIASIEKVPTQDGMIAVTFLPKVEGAYTVIPKLGKVPEIDIKILANKDESINKIELESSDTIKFIQDETTTAEIKFSHVYPDGRTIEIEGPDISKISSSLVQESDVTQNVGSINFLNEGKYLLSDVKSGDKVVKYASITPNKSGNLKLNITVTNKDDTLHVAGIDIEVKPIKLLINDGKTEITLCESEEDMEQAIVNGQKIEKYTDTIFDDSHTYYYTLIPISKLDENDNKISDVKVKDIYQLGFNTGKINFVDNVMYNASADKLNETMPSIDIKGFINGEKGIEMINNTSDSNTTKIDYIGIALKKNVNPHFESVIVYYENNGNKEVITTLELQKKEETNLGQ